MVSAEEKSNEMIDKPLVSVIMPFLNAEKFIQEAIESVLAQTYDNWELLLVDDGSADGSTAIAQKYAAQYPRKIRYLEHDNHQNRGTSASRNFGIRNAGGEYIAFLDSDDVWLPNKLVQQVAILDSYPGAAMVYGPSQFWNSWTDMPKDRRRDYVPRLGLRANNIYQPPALVTLCHPLGKGHAPCPSNILLRRKIVKDIGGFDEGFYGINQLYEDQAFLIKVYLKGSVFASSECWDRYRIHQDSCMSRTSQYHHQIRLFFLKWLEDYLIRQEIRDINIWKALHKAFWPYQHPQLYRLMKLPGNLVRQIKKPVKEIIRRSSPTKF
jgi:glycosyltransferase involved in cell wall biosynthesis